MIYTAPEVCRIVSHERQRPGFPTGGTDDLYSNQRLCSDLQRDSDTMRTIILSLPLALALAFVPSLTSAQNDSRSEVAKQAQELDHWLGTDANGNTWRSYLLLKKLIAEATADREA